MTSGDQREQTIDFCEWDNTGEYPQSEINGFDQLGNHNIDFISRKNPIVTPYHTLTLHKGSKTNELKTEWRGNTQPN